MSAETDEAPRHPETGGPMVRATRQVRLDIGGEEVTLAMQGWYCTETGKGLYVGKDLLPYDRAVRRAKALQQRLLPPEEVRRIRKKLKLSQSLASELVGGGPKAFQKYEAGDVLISRAVDGLLRVLDNDPAQLEILRKARALA